MISSDNDRWIVFNGRNIIVKVFWISIGKEFKKFKYFNLVGEVSLSSSSVNFDSLVQKLKKSLESSDLNKFDMSVSKIVKKVTFM